jgi:hypothetical protein
MCVNNLSDAFDTAGSLYPPACIVSGSGLGDLATGQTRYLQVLAMDQFGNVINSAYDQNGVTILFQLTVSGAEAQSTLFVYAGSGRHEQNFTPLTVGTYLLRITYDGVAVAASPYTMTASASKECFVLPAHGVGSLARLWDGKKRAA